MQLFVRFRTPVVRSEEGLEAAVDYLVRDDAGLIQSAGHTDATGFGEAVETTAPWADDPANVVVLVPVSDVLAASCKVPGRSAAQIRRAVPYAVEEFVADDIDTMQVASAEPVRNEPVRCLVAPRQSVEDWLAFLAEAGVQPGYLTADAMALDGDDHVVSVVLDGDEALVRSGDQVACVDLPNLIDVLEGVLAGLAHGEKEPVLRLINGTLADLGGMRPEGIEVEEVAVETTLLGFLASAFDGTAVNLLQGDYVVKRRPTGAWARWRPVAAAAGLWLAVGLVVLGAQGFWADFQASRLRAEAVELYRDIYNVDRVAGNPAVRMRRLLGQTDGSETSFHGLVGQFGVGLGNVSGTYELRGLAYSPRRGLDADVVVSNDAVLESLGGSLRQQGLDMEVISTDSAQSGSRIGARLRVSGG